MCKILFANSFFTCLSHLLLRDSLLYISLVEGLINVGIAFVVCSLLYDEKNEMMGCRAVCRALFDVEVTNTTTGPSIRYRLFY